MTKLWLMLQGLALEPEHLIVSAGCGAIINDLLYCITNSGEGVAVPAPYYPAFDNDIKVTHNNVPVLFGKTVKHWGITFVSV